VSIYRRKSTDGTAHDQPEDPNHLAPVVDLTRANSRGLSIYTVG
jgi:hypothetical protein